MNKMIIYCKNPKHTVSTFLKAIGTWNPQSQSSPPSFGPKNLDDFRKVVRDELELSMDTFDDPNLTWIAQLPGTDKII
jgi:hypothetical protein